MADDQPTTTPPEAPKPPTRRTAKKTKPIPPEEFFARIITGLLQAEGIAGIAGDGAVGVLANPQNAARWYGAYLVLCENWDRFMSDTSGRLMSAKTVPSSVFRVLQELNPAACFDPHPEE